MRLKVYLPFRGKGRRGLGRRVLALMGPTWLASPLRRLVQTGCLLLFAWLFFYVCWPYTARPARTWTGWLPAEVDAESGRVVLTSEQAPEEAIGRGKAVYVVDQANKERPCLGRFRVSSVAGQGVELEPVEPPSGEQLDALSTSLGPWSLNEMEPGGWPSHYADDLAAKEIVPVEALLALDPLVSVSAALAARAWVWSLTWAAVILAVCVLVPRGFCGYVCPLGTVIDVFDWAVGRRVKWFRVAGRGWWAGIRYYLLLAVLAAAMCGVLLAGFVAAIAVLTRGMVFLFLPLQTGLARGWHQVPPLGAGHYVSLALFFLVLGLGLLGPRFWCKYVCPTGAVFSIGNLLRLSERRVTSACVGCGKCVEICPLDAVRPDFTTRATNCTFCQTCGGACPAEATEFVGRARRAAHGGAGVSPALLRADKARAFSRADETPAPQALAGRRGFLAAAVGVVAGGGGGLAAAALGKMTGARLDDVDRPRPVRPPGSVPEAMFLQMCIRCGDCLQACPNAVLQPLGFQQGLEGLWTPHVAADWSGCEPSCNNCGQACPTGAIRAAPLEEKRAARMGLAVVDTKTCLPYAGREACQLCVDECVKAGYRAIEFQRVRTEVDAEGRPIEDSGFLAPVVRGGACVGCGLCQTRCYHINVSKKGLLSESAILIEAGAGKEDRLTSGSYVALRQADQRRQRDGQRGGQQAPGNESYLPEFLK